jgi:hypothetical protein
VIGKIPGRRKHRDGEWGRRGQGGDVLRKKESGICWNRGIDWEEEGGAWCACHEEQGELEEMSEGGGQNRAD